MKVLAETRKYLHLHTLCSLILLISHIFYISPFTVAILVLGKSTREKHEITRELRNFTRLEQPK